MSALSELNRRLHQQFQRNAAKAAIREAHQDADEILKQRRVPFNSSTITTNNLEYRLLPTGTPNTAPQAPHETRSESHPATGNTLATRYAAAQEQKRLVAIEAKKSWWQRRSERNRREKDAKEEAKRKAQNQRQAEIAANTQNQPDQLVYNHSHKGLLVIAVLGTCSLLSFSSFLLFQSPTPIDQPQAPPIPIVNGITNLPPIPGNPETVCKNTLAELLNKGPKRIISINNSVYYLTIAQVPNQDGLSLGVCAKKAFFPKQ